ncbi:MAG: type II secretion system F family protein [Pirellulaceae bacterium]
MTQGAGPIALVGLVFVGFALLWGRQWMYRNRTASHDDVLRLVMSLLGSLLVLVGLLGATAHMTLVFAPITCGLTLLVALTLVNRYRATERRALLRCIAIAADKGLPLDQAIRSFAKERSDEVGYRALVLAESLEVGMTLPQALQHARTNLPLDAVLAMRLGSETNTLGLAVTRVATADESLEAALRSLAEKYLYLACTVLLMTGCITFYMVRIVPVFDQMLREFAVEVPPLTVWCVTLAEVLATYWFWLTPLLVIPVAALVLLSLDYVGMLSANFPGRGWIERRLDAGLVMRCLALSVSLQWPMVKTIFLLSRIFPRRGMQARLAAAGYWMNNGEDWCESLRRAGVIRRVDAHVLRAAQRTGNVEWALMAMASRSARSLVERIRLLLNVAFPLILLVLGTVVTFFVLAFFLPLVELIQALI